MRKFGLIGFPLGHSYSARIFNESFRKSGSEDEYTLYPIDSIDKVRDILPVITGMNVTIPYKKAIIPYLNEVDREALEIGAVNCVQNRDGYLKGFNTDIRGIEASLKHLMLKDKQVIVMGTGGASSAVCYCLKKMGARVSVISRDPARADYSYDTLPDSLLREAKLIVNATPLGMSPNVDACPPLKYELISRECTLFDLIYNPEITLFLRKGEAQGASIIGGMTMFMEQARASWRIWTGEEIDF